MKRILDANFNRASEGLRIVEEIARFCLDDKELSQEFKKLRHAVAKEADKDYEGLLLARDTQGDVGVDIKNPHKRTDLQSVFKANIKRIQEALRVLAEYGATQGFDISTFEQIRYKTYTLEKKMHNELQHKFNQIRLNNRNLYLVTSSDKFENDDDFLNAVASSLKGGVKIVQLREKNSTTKRILALGKKIRELTSLFDAVFIVNDRADLAKVLDADGVHLGQDDMDIESARKILGADKIIGISTHEPKQALKAVEDGADYIGVGPVFETPTKAGRQAVGLEYVKWASENIDIPFYAIGGIDLDNIEKVIENGAKNIAVVRAIINAQSPEQSAAEFLKKLN